MVKVAWRWEYIADLGSVLVGAGVGGAVGIIVSKVLEMLSKKMELRETRRRDAAEAAWRIVDLVYGPVKKGFERQHGVPEKIKSYYKEVYQELLEKFRKE